MPTITRNSGLRITVPPTHKITDIVIPTTQHRRARAFGSTPLPADPVSAELANEAVIEALQEQEMELIDKVEIAPVPAPPAGRRRRPTAPTAPTQDIAEIEVDLAPHEDAVVLLEQDGMYSWSFPTEVVTERARPAGGGVRQPVSKRRIKFEIPVSTTMQPMPGHGAAWLIPEFLPRQS